MEEGIPELDRSTVRHRLYAVKKEETMSELRYPKKGGTKELPPKDKKGGK